MLDGSTYPGWKMSHFHSKNLFWAVKNATGFHPGPVVHIHNWRSPIYVSFNRSLKKHFTNKKCLAFRTFVSSEISSTGRQSPGMAGCLARWSPSESSQYLFISPFFRSSRSVGHVQDEHQRDPLPESAHQPAGGLPPDLPPLRRLGQPQRLSARPRVRPPLRLLRVGVQTRRRRNALLEGRIQVRKSKSPEFDSKPSKFFAPKWSPDFCK